MSTPEGWVDTDEDDGLPDEQPDDDDDDPPCAPADLLRMRTEDLG